MDSASTSSSSFSPSHSSSSTEEEDDQFDDSEFSFYRFSILHFQGGATHTHITERLSQSLLPHDDEGDALVGGQTEKWGCLLPAPRSSRSWSVLNLILQASLTVWWIILRFMGDKPEPKSLDAISEASSIIQSHLPHQQRRKLSQLVRLDQWFWFC